MRFDFRKWCEKSFTRRNRRPMHNRWRPNIETLEARVVPAFAGPLYTYEAGAGETNNVTVTPGPIYSVITDDPGVLITTAPPFVSADFLSGLSLEIGVEATIDTGSFEISFGVGFGFPIIPFQFPDGVLGPAFAAQGGTGIDINDLLGSAVQKAAGGVASAIAGAPVSKIDSNGDPVASGDASGDIYLQVNAAKGTLPGYRIYQSVVAADVFTDESEAVAGANDSDATATAITPDKLVVGNFADDTDIDVYKFTTTSIAALGSRHYSVVLDNDPDKADGLTGTMISILARPKDTGAPTLKASNVSFGDANAVGPVRLDGGLAGQEYDIYVLIERSGTGDDNDYRFVLMENRSLGAGLDAVGETEPNNTKANADSNADLDPTQYGYGSIPSKLDVDIWRIEEATDGGSTRDIEVGDLVFSYIDVTSDNIFGDPANGFSGQRRQNEMDSFLRLQIDNLEDGTLNELAFDDNDGPAISATSFEEVQSDIQGAADFDQLNTPIDGLVPIIINLYDGNDIGDLSRVNGNKIEVDGGSGHDRILHGGGENKLIGGSGNDTFVFNTIYSATVDATGGSGFDIIEVTTGAAAETILVKRVGDDIVVTVDSEGETTTAVYKGAATGADGGKSIEALYINAGDGDDIIIIDFTGGDFQMDISVGGDASTDELRIIEKAASTRTVIFRQDQTDQRDGSFEFVNGDNVSFESVESWHIVPLNPVTGVIGASGKLIVFDEDPFEMNDDRTNATPIAKINNLLTNLTIDLPEGSNRPADEDWFLFRAPKIGSYRFDIFFQNVAGLPGAGGELSLSVYDKLGNTIVHGLRNSDGASATLSAAKDQVYYVRVFGGTEAEQDVDSINTYDFQVVEVDKLGPQIFAPDGELAIQLIDENGDPNPDFDLFVVKPSDAPPVGGPTPLVYGLFINVRDLISSDILRRAAGDIDPIDDIYRALDEVVAAALGNYEVIGDRVGKIAINSVVVSNAQPHIPDSVVSVTDSTNFTSNLIADVEIGDLILFTSGVNTGQLRTVTSFAAGLITIDDPLVSALSPGDGFTLIKIATATIQINFSEALPDDRYTLQIKDGVTDPAGNKLDGESNAAEPNGAPTFPSGDGTSGGGFTARFTVDSRPEIGIWGSTLVFVDMNGDGVFNPDNDTPDRDNTFNYGLIGDNIFAGKFTRVGGIDNGFDKLGAYGLVNKKFRFALDFDGNGALAPDEFIENDIKVNGVPVAGNFDLAFTGVDSHPGDEVGVFDGVRWHLDTNGNNKIDALDTVLSSKLRGLPIVGDFDGDGLDDFGTYAPDRNTFQFDLNRDGIIDAVIEQVTFGQPGVQEKPVAADMNQDGIDDIGLYIPGSIGATSNDDVDWLFLISDPTLPRPQANATLAERVASLNNNLNHAYTPEPFGRDLAFIFGNSFSLPIVGNFDPPVGPPAATTALASISWLFNGSGSFIDLDGDLYTVKLKGPGKVSVIPDIAGGIGQILLSGTNAAQSKLTVTVKKAPGGDGQITIGTIKGSGLKILSAPAASLTGAGIELGGDLGSLTLNSVVNTSIVVDSLGKVKLQKVESSTITTTGSVKSFTTGAFIDSRLFAGFSPTVDPDNPMAGGTFAAASIGAFKVTGIRGSTDAAFANSIVAAQSIGKVSLASVGTTTGGKPFGVLAELAIRGLAIKLPRWRFDPTDSSPQGFDNFQVDVLS